MCALPYILDLLSKYFSGLLKEKTQPPFRECVRALPCQFSAGRTDSGAWVPVPQMIDILG